MHRHDEREAQISLPATISAYLGVTEPALFGVNVKYIYPFVAGMIGSSIAGLLSVTFNVTAASIGIGGLPGILSIQPKYMIPFAAIMLVAIIVPMVLTFFFRKAVLFTKTEDDIELKEEFAAQKRLNLHHILQLQQFLLNQQRLLAHLLVKLNHLAKQQTQFSHQVSWDRGSHRSKSRRIGLMVQ